MLVAAVKAKLYKILTCLIIVVSNSKANFFSYDQLCFHLPLLFYGGDLISLPHLAFIEK